MQPQDHFKDYSDCMPCPIDTCFGCVSGRCVIISGSAENGCFYKERSDAIRQIRHYFYQLISQERFDLLCRYADTYAELGLMDQEFAEIQQMQAELKAYQNADISQSDDAAWIPPYAEWFCDPDDADEKKNHGKGSDKKSSETTGNEDKDEEKTSADYQIFDSIPISNAAYDLREISSRERNLSGEEHSEYDEENADETEEKSYTTKTEYRCWISEDVFRRAMLELYSCYSREPRHKKFSLTHRANALFGASIVYDNFISYITVLRLLWSGTYQEADLHRLIVRKWECETFFGSSIYWLCTNINPERMMDRAYQRAVQECKAAIRRRNLKIQAGMIDE